MKCSNCGADLLEGAKFCRDCGAPVAAAPQPEAPQQGIPTYEEYTQQPAVGVSLKKPIWSLVLGCASLGSIWTAFIGPLGIITIILAIIGLVIGGKAKKENPANKMGKTGWILSLVALILGAIITIITTIAFLGAYI